MLPAAFLSFSSVLLEQLEFFQYFSFVLQDYFMGCCDFDLHVFRCCFFFCIFNVPSLSLIFRMLRCIFFEIVFTANSITFNCPFIPDLLVFLMPSSYVFFILMTIILPLYLLSF